MKNDEAQEPDPIRELKWKEIMSRVDAYRFYIKLCLEASAFFFATTGAILGFYLNQLITPSNYYLKFFLLLPILMGTVLGSICIFATRLQKEGSRLIKEVRKELARKSLEIELIPDVHLLDILLIIFGSIFFLVAALLIMVPVLKEEAFPKDFVVLASVIWGGGLLSTLIGICRHNKNLRKSRRRLKVVRRERRALLRQQAINERAALDAFVGSYEFGPGAVATVTKEGDALMWKGGRRPKVRLVPLSDTRFFVEESGVEMTFRKGDKGQATGVTLRVGTYQDTEAKRVE